ncbi:hypothetical protein AOQ84DRAFT_223942 [Glonium stellatum]|uniref:Rhodopsin domain-containing protein n=1 Tax=Glonium stellatum TaxID=574774 RepID=A0A8E2EXG9_9PEZI|nr:hypothetical protein AOQ84DRAFT_223942 [Glonium stellatum]
MATHSDTSLASRGQQEKAVAIAFLVATWVFVSLRIWVRTYMIHNFGWDDTTMILANIVFTFYCISMLYVQAHGGGTHLTEPTEIAKVINWTIAGEDTYIVTMCILKISLGIFFNRIVVKPWQRYVIFGVVAVSTLQSLASFFFIIFRCGPSPGHYLVMQLEGKCAPRWLNLLFLYMHAGITTITDWIFAMLPVSILWHTKMDVRSKLSVGFILTLSTLGSICSVIRFKYVDGLTRLDDFFWNATNCAIWSAIEPGAGIIAGCLATMRPLFRRAFDTTRTITLSASRSAKRISRPFRSNPNSAAQQSLNEKEKGGLKPANKGDSDRTQSTSMYSAEDGNTKLVTTTKRGETTDYMITQNDDADGPWLFNRDNRGVLVTRNAESDDGLEIDRRSSHTLGEEEAKEVRFSFVPPATPEPASEPPRGREEE